MNTQDAISKMVKRATHSASTEDGSCDIQAVKLTDGDHDLRQLANRYEREGSWLVAFDDGDGYEGYVVDDDIQSIGDALTTWRGQANVADMHPAWIEMALHAGLGEVRHKEDCNCTFDWVIGGQDGLDSRTDGDECWEGHSLYIGDTLIAEHVRFEAIKIHFDGLSVEDIPEDIQDEMRMSEMVEQGDSPNCDVHESSKRTSLIQWLMDNNYELDRDDQRGFANEYTMILRDSESKPTLEQATDWADDYLYAGDAATKANVGFELAE